MGDMNNNTRGKTKGKPTMAPQNAKKPKLEEHGGTTYMFGMNIAGQLGLGTSVSVRRFPAKVTELDGRKVIQLKCGGMHAVALTENGQVYTWGCNDDLALGRETEEEEDSAVPGLVDFGEKKIVQISAGDSHSAAVTEEGELYIWGSFRNQGGDIGLLPGGEKIPLPKLITFAHEKSPEPKLTKIASGSHHIVSLFDDSSIFTFGDGELGQLGRFLTTRSLRSNEAVNRTDGYLTPQKIGKQLKNVCDLWAGYSATFCKTDKGEIWAFGLNSNSQLGFVANHGQNADREGNVQFIPKKVHALNPGKPWKQIACGEHHTLALNEEGHVFGFGRAHDGRLGFGEDENEVTRPTRVTGALENEKCVLIACGGSTSYAVTASNKLYAWGFGENYQLGCGDDDVDKNVPTLCKAGKETHITGKILAISAGSQHAGVLVSGQITQDKP